MNCPGVRIIRPGRDFIKLNYAGAVILFACIFGGGTTQGLWSDHLVEILMIPAVLIGYSSLWHNHLDAPARLLVLFVMAFMALQFVPFSPPHSLPPPPSGIETLNLWTLSPSRSLNTVLFGASILGFGLFVATLSGAQQTGLLRFVFLGLAINLIISVVQLSYSGNTRVADVLPFQITSALFANQNHFSAMIVAAIPLFAWRNLVMEKRLFVFLAIMIILAGLLFAIGSRAGMGISVFLAILCLTWFSSSSKSTSYRIALLALVVFAAGSIYFYLATSNTFSDELRLVFAKNTLAAISGNWVWGTGLGTFGVVYPYYEPLDDVIDTYVNHAHNDFLELLLEGGIVFALLLASFIVLTVKNMFRSRLTEAAGLSIVAILLHSTVDYPLRTMAVATVFITVCAILNSHFEDKKT